MTTAGGLGLLGLGARAGSLVIGVAGVRAGLQRGELALIVVANDHSPRTGEKVIRLARAVRVPVVSGPAATVLGHGLGRAAVQAVGVRDPRLAEGMLAAGDGEAFRRL